VPIRVRIEKRGDEMTIDLSDVSRQVRGFYNSGITTGFACAQVAFKCLTTPTDYPVNDGAFRNLKVIMPLGRVISAERPAPMRWWMTFPMTVVDTVFKAMAQAIPDRVIAGHHADLCVGTMHGIHPADGRFFIGSTGPIGGGWGGKATEDGISCTVCINDGDTHNGPSEQMEAKYPVLVERYELRPDSGGPGKWRGGLGAKVVVQALAPLTVDTYLDRVTCKPWGLHGGQEGEGNGVGIRNGGKWREDLANGKATSQRLRPGDAFMLCSGGGGGFGDPHERPAERVAEDVAEGYLSPEQARRAYGVVVDEHGVLDEAATASLRSERAAAE
jgi:N-methylhydantoinase B